MAHNFSSFEVDTQKKSLNKAIYLPRSNEEPSAAELEPCPELLYAEILFILFDFLLVLEIFTVLYCYTTYVRVFESLFIRCWLNFGLS